MATPTCRIPAHVRTRTPGFTLFELLIAISIVVAISALVIPSVRTRAGHAREAVGQIRDAIAEARSLSQRLALPVELVIRIEPGGSESIEVRAVGEAESMSGASFPLPDAVTFESDPVSENPPAHGATEVEGSDVDLQAPLAPGAPEDGAETAGARMLCVVLPDGAVVWRGPKALFVRGVRWSISAGRWTGDLGAAPAPEPGVASGGSAAEESP